MSIIASFMRAQQTQKLSYSQEEIEEICEEVEEVVDESEGIDTDVDDVAVAEDAVETMEAMVDLVSGMTGMSQEAYVQSMAVVEGILRTARLPVDPYTISTEEVATVEPAARKEEFTDKVKSSAGKLKDAIVETTRKIFKAIKEFFNRVFDKIARVRAGAASKVEAFKSVKEVNVPAEMTKTVNEIDQFKSVSAQVGAKAVAGVKQLQADGTQVLSSISKIRVPAGMVGEPTWDDTTGVLNVQWPEFNGAFVKISGETMSKVMSSVVEICDDILKQRDALKGSVLAKDDSVVDGIAKDEAAAKKFTAALKMVNGVYKMWITYAGRVTSALVACKPVAEEKPAE